jgi:defect-in-organelle-trafficking protein DotC
MKLLHKINLYLLAGLTAVSFFAHADQTGDPNPNNPLPNPIDKSSYMRASHESADPKMINMVRLNGLRETALSVGARGGLFERANEINNLLADNSWVLNRIFKFYGLILNDNVLPPVLTTGKNAMTLAGHDVIHIADQHYEIVQQARFVTAPPSWRDYLWMNYQKPDMPDNSLLPRNKYEREIWKRDLDEGWAAGRKQAELIYNENLNKLARDFNGMILYRTLLAKNMVSAPFVATMNMGITGDKSDLTINDRILRITSFPQFQLNGNSWKTDIYLHE